MKEHHEVLGPLYNATSVLHIYTKIITYQNYG